MPDTGYVDAGTGGVDTSVGSAGWSFTNFITTSDNNHATEDTDSADHQSYYITATNFGLSVPSGATIDGVEARVEYAAPDGTTADTNVASVKLIKGGTVSGTDKAAGTQIPTNDTLKSWGGSSDLWGLTLSDTDVNASNFGFAFSANVNRNDTVWIDVMTIRVWYTESGIEETPSPLVVDLEIDYDPTLTKIRRPGSLSVTFSTVDPDHVKSRDIDPLSVTFAMVDPSIITEVDVSPLSVTFAVVDPLVIQQWNMDALTVQFVVVQPAAYKTPTVITFTGNNSSLTQSSLNPNALGRPGFQCEACSQSLLANQELDIG